MKSSLSLMTLVFGGLVAAAVAGPANAQTFSVNSPVGQFTASQTTPWTNYSYTSPRLSVFAGVQFGNNQSTAINQNSARNVSSLAQVGNNVSTTVTQRGAANLSSIGQVGRNSSALVFQFGQ